MYYTIVEIKEDVKMKNEYLEFRTPSEMFAFLRAFKNTMTENKVKEYRIVIAGKSLDNSNAIVMHCYNESE